MIPMAYGSSSAVPPRPWTFAEITTALWLDAADSSTLFDATSGGSLPAADGAIARTEDKSGNARHFPQPTSGSRPIRKTVEINGLDVIRFDGSNDFLENTSLVLPIASQITFLVFRENSAVANAGIISYKPTSGNDFDTFTGKTISTSNRSTASFNIFTNNFNYALVDARNPASAIPTTIYTEVTEAGTSYLYQDGNLVSTDTHGTLSTSSGGGVAIGARYSSSAIGTPYGNFDLCEWVVVSGSLSTDDFDKAVGSLVWKWGDPANLPSGHPYESAPPTI